MAGTQGLRPRAWRKLALIGAALGVLCGPIAAAQGSSAPDAGRAWEPPPLRNGDYDLGPAICVKPFTEDPFDKEPVNTVTEGCGVKKVRPDHVLRVPTSDGETIYVEVWLPHQKEGGPPPPKRVPVVALLSPYHQSTEFTGGMSVPVQVWLIERGYAYAQVHLRGTGMSSGCVALHSPQEADDSARVVEELTSASWSNGRVGIFGVSAEAGAAINVAGRGDFRRVRGLRAVMASSPALSPADFRTRDGVVIGGRLAEDTLLINNREMRTVSPTYFNVVNGYEFDAKDRATCPLAAASNAASTQGGPTPWELDRDLRAVAGDIGVPVLYTMGLQEVSGRQAGFFDQLGARRPRPAKKVALFGQWGHSTPDGNGRQPSWARADWGAMFIAWFDRWMTNDRNGVDDWPTVQIQDTTGQWRTEPDWPLTGGDVGHLVLGPGGKLGAVTDDLDDTAGTVVAPSASLAPAAQGQEVADGTALTWWSDPLDADLRLTGVPVLDARVIVDKPGGQLVAEVVAFDEAGARLPFTRRVGARSLRYLEPIVEERFQQTSPIEPSVGQVLTVHLRFDAGDLVVPRGGRLRLRLGAVGPVMNSEMARGVSSNTPLDALYADRYWSVPDAAGARITVLHDCTHTTALRFLMPDEEPDLIDVRETDQLDEELGTSDETTSFLRPSLATASVCGTGPVRLPSFGAAR